LLVEYFMFDDNARYEYKIPIQSGFRIRDLHDMEQNDCPLHNIALDISENSLPMI
jgi:hypothetical protein